jgi:hypothetical protein
MLRTGALFIALLILLLTGCATGVTVQVNAIADPSIQAPGKKYLLTNALVDGPKDDLFFREFAAYFEKALATKGYQRVEDRGAADIIVAFSFGVSDGRTGINTFSFPIYESFGGETITIRETDSGGNVTTRTVTIPPRYQIVGTQFESQSYTIYAHTAMLEARLPAPEGQSGKLLWKTVITSVNETNDLRTIMPYLAAAAAPYLGGNTGEQKKIELKPDAPAVVDMRSTVKR